MKKKLKKVKQRLPIELVLTLRTKGAVVDSKKNYNRKNVRSIIKNEICNAD
jgi:hypothetical protein